VPGCKRDPHAILKIIPHLYATCFTSPSLYYKIKRLELTVADNYNPLVERCKDGDPRSYSELYHQYCKAMFSTCYRLLNNYPEAEDVLQEAFSDAFKHLHSFEYKSSFGAWLKQIVINKCITKLRKQKVTFVEFNPTSMTEVAEEEEITETEIAFRINEVKQAIQQLPNGYRTVLSLYLLEGYDHEEIAEILGITHSTTRTQYKRAKDKLLLMLKNGAHEHKA
jgi:RNA polymerase sigma factor (sigma-70 family)